MKKKIKIPKKSIKKKPKKQEPKPYKREVEVAKKCMVKKFKLKIGGQNKVFDSQSDARDAAIKCLETGHVYFLSLEEVKEEGC